MGRPGSRENGAQALVALDQVAQSSLQRGRIQRTAQTHGHRNIIGWAGAFQAVQEPEPALRKGQRNLSRALDGPQRRPCRLGLIKSPDQPGHRGGLEQAADGQLELERSADAADEARSQQRVTAQLKEVVLNAHLWDGQGFGKERAEDLFLGVRGARQAALALAQNSGAGSALRSSLPFGRKRQSLQHHDGPRHHVILAGFGQQ